ncbi:MAG: hypothetical protein JNM72_07715 [Deltaproteobacteria bacterium]|nr:hypothetical protein [Deltaproteobacteria bacterium]
MSAGGIWRALGWGLGALWWWALPIRRAEATAALRSALPSAGPPGPLLRRAVGSAALGYLELLFGRPMEIDGLEGISALLRPDRGLWCLAGHHGPWDLLLVRASAAVPISIFVRAPSGRLSRAALAHLRRRGGDLELLSPAAGIEAATAAYARGRVVVFVQDQRHNRGVAAPFFGRPAKTSTGLARALAAHPGPVLWAEAWRAADGRPMGALDLRVVRPGVDPTTWSQTQHEGAARARPGDWWWLHKRWA